MRLLLWTLIGVIGAVLAVALLTRGLALMVPAAVTSWWRSPFKNIGVGGLTGSAHLVGWAVDFAPVSPAVERAARAVFPVVVNEGDHIHAAVFRA